MKKGSTLLRGLFTNSMMSLCFQYFLTVSITCCPLFTLLTFSLCRLVTRSYQILWIVFFMCAFSITNSISVFDNDVVELWLHSSLHLLSFVKKSASISSHNSFLYYCVYCLIVFVMFGIMSHHNLLLSPLIRSNPK